MKIKNLLALGVFAGLTAAASAGGARYLFFAMVWSCSSSDGGMTLPDRGGTDATLEGRDGTTLPACSWPASLGPNDASTGACRNASRAVLSCTQPSGAGELCLSNDLVQCSDMSAAAAAPSGAPRCQDLCQPDEFGIICGPIGPTTTGANPPSNCRSLLPTPAGIVFYCCPCES
jgi:hypothetical protein